jgi:hypothetical protein
MKPLYIILGVIFYTFSFASEASETAKATMFCYSLRFQRGVEADGNYFLDLGSSTAGTDGELALDFFSSGYTHSAYLSLTDELFGDTIPGQLAIDVPDGGDANKDGFPDFFQVSQAVANLASSGADHLASYGDGAVTATWNRNTGSKDGSCRLSIKLLPFQPVVFTLPFEILEYTGPILYTPGTSNVTATVNLAQTGNPTSVQKGPAQFVKTPTDRFNELTLRPGFWTNQSEQAMSYVEHVVSRLDAWPTNYYGYLEFDDDNNPNTFYPYGFWMLSIDDLNDTNRNGIPDFSDDPGGKPLARQPSLEVFPTGTNVLLTLHGDVGYTHEIQQISDLSTSNWQTAGSVVLINDPQVVLVPLPSSKTIFWRARAH